MKIAIGPTIEGAGGVPQHVWNIKDHSKYSKDIDVLLYPKKSFRTVPFIGSLLEKKCIRYAVPSVLLHAKYILPNYDIVHLHGHPYFPEYYVRSKKRKAKYIHTVHRYYTEDDVTSYQNWNVLNWLNEQMFISCKNSDVVISVSKWIQEVLDKSYGIKSVYIPNGTHVNEVNKGDSKSFKQKYNITDDFYLFVGRLHPAKKPELILNLAKKIPNRKFVMVGPGCTRDEFLKYFKCDIPTNIIFLGKLTHLETIDAYSACKVFVLPSMYEAFPTVILEAMANKKVVVASNSGGSREIIRNGVDGFLFEPENLSDLHEKALLAWDNSELGENGYFRVKAEFDWGVLSKKIDAVYESLL